MDDKLNNAYKTAGEFLAVQVEAGPAQTRGARLSFIKARQKERLVKTAGIRDEQWEKCAKVMLATMDDDTAFARYVKQARVSGDLLQDDIMAQITKERNVIAKVPLCDDVDEFVSKCLTMDAFKHLTPVQKERSVFLAKSYHKIYKAAEQLSGEERQNHINQNVRMLKFKFAVMLRDSRDSADILPPSLSRSTQDVEEAPRSEGVIERLEAVRMKPPKPKRHRQHRRKTPKGPQLSSFQKFKRFKAIHTAQRSARDSDRTGDRNLTQKIRGRTDVATKAAPDMQIRIRDGDDKDFVGDFSETVSRSWASANRRTKREISRQRDRTAGEEDPFDFV